MEEKRKKIARPLEKVGQSLFCGYAAVLSLVFLGQHVEGNQVVVHLGQVVTALFVG